MKKKVAIIMGSDSDWPVMKEAAEALEKHGVAYDVEVVSAHRTVSKMVRFATQAEKNYAVIIAGAGGAAHLPGMVASMTTLPVIGIPVKLKRLGGLDSLLSIAQMPKGVPVATMAVDNAYNGGLLAARIMGLSSVKVRNQLKKTQQQMQTKVKVANKKLKAQLMDEANS